MCVTGLKKVYQKFSAVRELVETGRVFAEIVQSPRALPKRTTETDYCLLRLKMLK